MAWRLYLPQERVDDKPRREKAGVPEEVEFATKNEIAVGQIRAAKAAGVPWEWCWRILLMGMIRAFAKP